VDVTVLDVGSSLEVDEEISSDVFAPRRNAATIAALREADHVVAVGSADPVGMSRFLRAYAELIETVSTHSVTVVMNRLRASAIGLAPATQVSQTLARFGGIEHAVMVPYDRPAFDAALLAGRAVGDVSPRSAARIAVRDLAWARWVPQTVAPVKRSLVERALGGRQRATVSG
jgi:MinD-like ATPase involved in chromosome partitioning or flagellar assembly